MGEQVGQVRPSQKLNHDGTFQLRLGLCRSVRKEAKAVIQVLHQEKG